MANRTFLYGIEHSLEGNSLVEGAGNADLRVKLLMSNTTVDTDSISTTTIQNFTTLDEHDGANYVEKQLASQDVSVDTSNGFVKITAGNVTWTSLGAGTRAIAGALVYIYIDGAADIPLFWYDTPAFPNSNGGDYTIQWHANGLATVS